MIQHRFLHSNELEFMMAPMIYIAWGDSERPLYVGSSTVGLARVFSTSHVSIRTACEVGIVSLQMIRLPNMSKVALRDIEAIFVWGLKPKLNLKGKTQRGFVAPKRLKRAIGCAFGPLVPQPREQTGE